MKQTIVFIRAGFIMVILVSCNTFCRGESFDMGAGISATSVSESGGTSSGMGSNDWSKGTPLVEASASQETDSARTQTGDSGYEISFLQTPGNKSKEEYGVNKFFFNYMNPEVNLPIGGESILTETTLLRSSATPEEKQNAIKKLGSIAITGGINESLRANALQAIINTAHRDTLGEETYQFALKTITFACTDSSMNNPLREIAVSSLLDEAVNEHSDLDRKGDLLKIISGSVKLAGDDTSLKTRAGIYLNNYGILNERNQEYWDTYGFIVYEKTTPITQAYKVKLDVEFKTTPADKLAKGGIVTIK